MAIKRYSGDRFTGLSSDTKPTGVEAGAIFTETDTTTLYQFDGSSWNELAYASTNHTHTESDITDLGNYAVVGHSHSTSDITSGTFANARISASSVQQHVTKAYIDGLNVDADTLDGSHASAFATAGHSHGLGDLSNVVLSSLSTDDFLQYNGTNWVNAAVSPGSSLWTDDGDGSISYSGNVDVNGAIVATDGTSDLILEPNGSSYAILRLNSSGTADNNYLIAYGDGNGSHPEFAMKNLQTDGQLTFYTNSGKRLTITSNGDVGINTTTTSALLDVNGSGRFSGDVTLESGNFGGNTIHRTGTVGNVVVGYKNDSSTTYYIGVDVDTGIFGMVDTVAGIADSPFKVDIASGNVTATDFIATSDARIKSNETPITNALDSIRNINPYHFDKDGERKVGYIAQNVEQYTENIVSQIDRNGWKDFRVMNMFGMQAYNTAAIKEVDSEVQLLKKKVDQMQKRIKTLEAA